MEDNRLQIVVLFGGLSGEHEVSLNSAQSVLQAIDRNRYEVQTIGITQEGSWVWGVTPEQLLRDGFPARQDRLEVTLIHDPMQPHFLELSGKPLPNNGKFDLVFPVLHGPYGEDGTIQGLFEMARIPYVGSGVLGSALGMDKDRMKAVFGHAGLPQAHYTTLLRSEYRKEPTKYLSWIEENIGYPCFVKPANLGSSVGISKAHDREELAKALQLAATYDRKMVVEENISGREVEVSVLGNDNPMASLPGEIIPAHEFYDYEAKYIDEGSRLLIPAPLDSTIISQLQELAVKAFRAVDAAGLGRVDFFVAKEGAIYVNEINTMPGFTKISMYPKLWEASGIPYSQLVDQLITLGLERFTDNQDRKIVRS